MTYGYVSWFGVIVPYLKIVGLPLTTTWVVVYREGMTSELTVYMIPARLRGRDTLVRVWARDLAHARLIVSNTYGERMVRSPDLHS